MLSFSSIASDSCTDRMILWSDKVNFRTARGCTLFFIWLYVLPSFLQNTDQTTHWRSVRAVDQTATTANTWTRSSTPSKVRADFLFYAHARISVCGCWALTGVCLFVLYWPVTHLESSLLCLALLMCGFIHLFLFLYVSVWDWSRASLLFCPLSVALDILLCVNMQSVCESSFYCRSGPGSW